MKRNLLHLFLMFCGFVALAGLSGCARKDKDSAKKMIESYWYTVFAGDAAKAYKMLTKESRQETSLEDYAEQIAFGLEDYPAKDSFWEVYCPECSVSLGPTRISGDTAEVELLLTLPHLPALVKDLNPQADSLFTEADSVAREQWLLRELTAKINKKHFMPLIMHITVRLAWRNFNWYLIYE